MRFTICAKTKHNKKLVVSKQSAFRGVNQSQRTLTSLLAQKKEQTDFSQSFQVVIAEILSLLYFIDLSADQAEETCRGNVNSTTRKKMKKQRTTVSQPQQETTGEHSFFIV